MTATLETLSRQIRSAEDLSSVVRTMKTLAAVSIRQYEEAVESLRDYRRNVENGLRMLLWETRPSELPEEASRQKESARELAVVFGSDQGMCGQFNQQIVTFFSEGVSRVRADADIPPEPVVIAVGHRCAGLLEETGFPIAQCVAGAGSVGAVIECVQDLLTAVDQLRREHDAGRVALYFSQRVTATLTEPHRARVLPVELRRFIGHRERHAGSRCLPMNTLPRAELLSSLLREHLFVSLFRACAESLSSENAARIQSMQTAERNITERLRELRSEFHQSRQTSITEELLDVVSGFQVLKKSSGTHSLLQGRAGS